MLDTIAFTSCNKTENVFRHCWERAGTLLFFRLIHLHQTQRKPLQWNSNRPSFFIYLPIFATWVDWICVDNISKVFWATWITGWEQKFLYLSGCYSLYASFVTLLRRRLHGLPMADLNPYQLLYMHWHVVWAKRKFATFESPKHQYSDPYSLQEKS